LKNLHGHSEEFETIAGRNCSVLKTGKHISDIILSALFVSSEEMQPTAFLQSKISQHTGTKAVRFSLQILASST